MTLAKLDELLNPKGRLSLNSVIASLDQIKNRLVGQDTVELRADDLRTLLDAARYGRNCAEAEVARQWGSFG